MSGRIWPGALCFVKSGREAGRIVEALHIVTSTNQGREGCLLADSAVGTWMCEFQGRPIYQRFLDGVVRAVRFVPIEESGLRPITPPPSADTTEDRSPCELEAV